MVLMSTPGFRDKSIYFNKSGLTLINRLFFQASALQTGHPYGGNLGIVFTTILNEGWVGSLQHFKYTSFVDCFDICSGFNPPFNTSSHTSQISGLLPLRLLLSSNTLYFTSQMGHVLLFMRLVGFCFHVYPQSGHFQYKFFVELGLIWSGLVVFFS